MLAMAVPLGSMENRTMPVGNRTVAGQRLTSSLAEADEAKLTPPVLVVPLLTGRREGGRCEVMA